MPLGWFTKEEDDDDDDDGGFYFVFTASEIRKFVVCAT